MAAGQLFDRDAAVGTPALEADGGQQLIGIESRRPGAKEEVGGGHLASASWRGRLHDGIERQRDRRLLGGGVGVGERSTDRSPVADLEVPDLACRCRQQRRGRANLGVLAHHPVAGHGAQGKPLAVVVHTGELVERVQVDQMFETSQSQGEHGHQALTASQHLGLLTMLSEKAKGLAERLGAVVGEGSRLHLRVPVAVISVPLAVVSEKSMTKSQLKKRTLT